MTINSLNVAYPAMHAQCPERTGPVCSAKNRFTISLFFVCPIIYATYSELRVKSTASSTWLVAFCRACSTCGDVLSKEESSQWRCSIYQVLSLSPTVVAFAHLALFSAGPPKLIQQHLIMLRRDTAASYWVIRAFYVTRIKAHLRSGVC